MFAILARSPGLFLVVPEGADCERSRAIYAIDELMYHEVVDRQLCRLFYTAHWVIGHFRITSGLVFEPSLGAHPFICKSIFIHTQIKLIFMWMKIDLHIKRWAPRLALKKRHEVIRKWPTINVPCGWKKERGNLEEDSSFHREDGLATRARILLATSASTLQQFICSSRKANISPPC